MHVSSPENVRALLAGQLHCSGLEAGCFLRAACNVAWLVGVSARSGELAALDDQVLLADRPVLKPAFEDLASARGVACACADSDDPEMGGGMPWGGIVRHGGSRGAGWGDQTSPA